MTSPGSLAYLSAASLSGSASTEAIVEEFFANRNEELRRTHSPPVSLRTVDQSKVLRRSVSESGRWTPGRGSGGKQGYQRRPRVPLRSVRQNENGDEEGRRFSYSLDLAATRGEVTASAEQTDVGVNDEDLILRHHPAAANVEDPGNGTCAASQKLLARRGGQLSSLAMPNPSYVENLIHSPPRESSPSEAATQVAQKLAELSERIDLAVMRQGLHAMGVQGDLAYDQFAHVARNVFFGAGAQQHFEWAMVAGFLCFGFVLGVNHDMPEDLFRWTVRFFGENLEPWIAQQGGWMALLRQRQPAAAAYAKNDGDVLEVPVAGGGEGEEDEEARRAADADGGDGTLGAGSSTVTMVAGIAVAIVVAASSFFLSRSVMRKFRG